MKIEAYIFILVLILYVNGEGCPNGWVDGPSGKKCYLFAKNHQRSWFESKYMCQSMRAQLLSVEDSTEMQWLRDTLKRLKNPNPGKVYEWWTSLNNQANLSNWVWTGDVPLDTSVIQWAQDEPNNYLNNERCGEICCPYYLNDKSCNTNLNYICELDKETSPLTCDADNGWEYHNGSCYKFVRKYRTFNDSVSDCKDLDSDLATVTGTDTKSSITMMANFQQSDTWVGLYKIGKIYYYTNSSIAAGIQDYLQPNRPPVNKNRICMSVNSTSQDHKKDLYGDDCTTSKPYICQKPEGVCRPGWLQHQSTCYYISASRLAKKTSGHFCRIMGLSPVSITSASKLLYLLNVLKKKDNTNEIWIGLKKQGNDWYWPSTGEQPTIDYWANDPAEKNESINDCVYMNTGDGGKWHNNLPCDTKLKFVCESPALTSYTTTTMAPLTTTTKLTTVLTTTTTSYAGITPSVNTTALPCSLEYCEDVFDAAKQLEKYSPVMIEAAKNYSEVPHCISLRSRVQCLKQQHKQCLHHFQYHVQVTGLQQIMDALGCSNDTSAAVFDPKLMVLECRMNQVGLGYRGKLSTTKQGRTCQAWSSQTPQKHRFHLYKDQNYCRNPDKEPSGPWCYTTDGNQRWEYCDVPYCPGAVTPTTTITTPTTTTATARPTTGPVWSPKCGLFWEEMSQNSDVCHHIDERLMNWMAARQKCKDIGGDLASITSIQEQYYLTGRLKTGMFGSVWIGANSRGEDEGWKWSDEAPFSFLFWLPGQPDGIDSNENCVSMDTKGKGTWQDKQCDEKLGFVCRKSVPGKTSPTFPPTSPSVGKDQMYACQDGWASYRSNCYFVNRTKTTWKEASTFCRLNSAELASIAEEGEHDFITSQLPKKFCYNIHQNDTQCKQWAASGECQKNPVWMAQHCNLACNKCTNDCKDIHYTVECEHWAKKGECSTNHDWMLANCALSCGVCDGAIYGGFWIGLNDRRLQMSFEWADDTPVTYTKWAKTEPNNFDGMGKEDCVIMLLKNGYWNDVKCGIVNPGFICKKRKQVLDKVTESPFAIGCENDTLGYDAYCYGFNDEKTDWATAEKICNKAPFGHLATINDRYVQAFLSSQLVGKTGDYWIGLAQDINSGAIESWSGGLPVLFTHWAKSHTGSIDEDAMCVAMTSNHPVGLWTTQNCTYNKSYICEYPRTGFTTSTTTTTTIRPPTCPSGWLTNGDFCYKRMTNKMTWMKGRDFCRQLGADLVSIHNAYEDSFIKSTIRYSYGSSEVWIGLNDRDSENGFIWSDGSPFDFAQWNRNEPNDKYNTEDCVLRSRYSSGWNDDNCYKKKLVVCKIMKGIPLLEPNDTFTEEYCDAGKEWLFFNDYCYFVKKYQSLNFKDARQKCLDKQSDLLSIHSQHEANWLLETVSHASDMWIGLNQLSRHYDHYRWSDRTAVDFIHWQENRPAFSYNKCVKMVASTGRWYDMNCFQRVSGYICKRRNDTDSTLPTLPPLPAVKGGCAAGFTRGPFNDKCYQLNKVKKSWNNAKTACQSLGKGFNLVSIHSQLEQLFISSMLINLDEKVWIGLTDTHSYNKYYWNDGTDFDYDNWNSKEPNGYSEHCADMFFVEEKFAQWNDERCSYLLYYMCQGYQNQHIPITTPGNDCPSGYTMYDSNCYKYIETENSWNQSSALCQQDGGTLTSLRNLPEKYFIDYISYNKSSSPFWIGLYKEKSQDIKYKWINGWPLVYSNWNPDAVSPTKLCVAAGDFWTDKNCDEELPAVCQINKKSPPPTPAAAYCNEGGFVYKERCYYPSIHDRLNWLEAKDSCEGKGQNLVSIQNLDQIEFMINLILQLTGTRTKIWIGLNKLEVKYRYSWKWTDGSSSSYFNWDSGEPSSRSWSRSDEECVEMRPNGKWNDISCRKYEKPYICTGDIVDKPPTTMEPPAKTTTVAIETTEATTQLQSKTTTLKPNTDKSISSKKLSTTTVLTTGQVIGIIIGLMGCLVIVAAILFIVKFNRQKAGYNTNNHSFSNALYLKTTENINDDDHSETGSTVKICGTDTL